MGEQLTGAGLPNSIKITTTVQRFDGEGNPCGEIRHQVVFDQIYLDQHQIGPEELLEYSSQQTITEMKSKGWIK